MKIKIAIKGTIRGTIPAILMAETTGEWIPLNVRDIGRCSEFMPDTLHEVEIVDDIGYTQFGVQTTIHRPCDRRPREYRLDPLREAYSD